MASYLRGSIRTKGLSSDNKPFLRSAKTTSEIIRTQVNTLLSDINQQSFYITDYHSTFDELYRASERIRHQQKYQFLEQSKIAQAAHKEELQEIEDCRYQSSTVYNTVDFEPVDLEVNDVVEQYFLLAAEQGVSIMDVLPATLLSESLHYYSSSSYCTSSDGSSSSSLC